MRHSFIKTILFLAIACLLTAQVCFADATFVKVNGDVSWQGSGSAAWNTADTGARASAGSSVKTGASSQAVMSWPGGHSIKISESTILKISRDLWDPDKQRSQLEFDLKDGRVLANVQRLKTTDSSFVIKSPVAMSGVRGTAFECTYDAATQKFTVRVIEGRIFIIVNEIEKFIEAGRQVTIGADDKSVEPAPIPQDRLDELNSELAELQIQSPFGSAEQGSDVPLGWDKRQEDQLLEKVIDNVVQDVTVQNLILDTVEQVLTTCPAGYSCFGGIISF